MDGLLFAGFWFFGRFFSDFFRRFSLVGSDSDSLDFQSLVHIETLFSIQTLNEFASGLSNRTADTGRIDLDSAPFRSRLSIFIFQGDVVSIQNDLQTVSYEPSYEVVLVLKNLIIFSRSYSVIIHRFSRFWQGLAAIPGSEPGFRL